MKLQAIIFYFLLASNLFASSINQCLYLGSDGSQYGDVKQPDYSSQISVYGVRLTLTIIFYPFCNLRLLK